MDKLHAIHIAEWLENNSMDKLAAAELRRLHQSEQEGWRWAKECEAEVQRLKECLFQMQNAAADLSKKNQELVEALEGLDEAYCRAGSPLNKQERHEDRMRLIVARRVIAKHKEQA